MFTYSEATREVSWDNDGLVYHLHHVTLYPSWFLLDTGGFSIASQSHRQRICILWPDSITVKQSGGLGGVVNRYKCQFLSSHLSTSGIFFCFDILSSLWCTFSGSVCTLKLFNNAFYVHMLFIFFHGVSWQRIKYIYFKGEKKNLLCSSP